MSVSDAQRIMELKRQAQEFYAANSVPQKMEDVLNSMFYDRPNDIFGHLANYFEGFAAVPKISKINCREVLDSSGQVALQVDLFCTVKNKEKLVASCVCAQSQESLFAAGTKLDSPEEVDARRAKTIRDAAGFIRSNVLDAITDLDPRKQEDVDTVLANVLSKLKSDEEEREKKEREAKEAEDGDADQEPIKSSRSSDSKKGNKTPRGKNKGPSVTIIPDEPKEQLFSGCSFVSHLSQLSALGAASLTEEPLYRHLSSLYHGQIPDAIRMPIPMVTVMMSGKSAPGKLNAVKEFMVMPRPGMPLSKSVNHIGRIFQHCARIISNKVGVTARATNDQGALWVTCDRVEQGLDMLQEAMTQAGLTPGEDFQIAINCAAHEIFDYEKGKYEVVTGQMKSAEDLADFWSDILTRYPSVVCLIDPLRKVEREAWLRLAERLSNRCYVTADEKSPRPGLLTAAEVAHLHASAACLRLQDVTSVTELLAAVRLLQDSEIQSVISVSSSESSGSFISDLAVACGARFIHVGGLCGGGRVEKLNRLVQIEEALETEGCLRKDEEAGHTFTLIKPPTPQPDNAEQPDDTANTSTQGADN